MTTSLVLLSTPNPTSLLLEELKEDLPNLSATPFTDTAEGMETVLLVNPTWNELDYIKKNYEYVLRFGSTTWKNEEE